jgi:uncharacterized repeat protein (TIGR01451 family)
VSSSNGSNHLASHPGDGQSRTDQASNVGNGTVFYLVNTATGAVLAQVTVTTTTVGCVTPPTGYAQLQITKLVQDQNYATAYAKSVNAYPNDRVTFKITVTNIGTAAATGTYLTDAVPSGLSYLTGTTAVDGATVADITAGNVSLGSVAPNQQHVITFSTTVANSSNVSTTIQNIASATASNAYQVQDYATVFVQAQSAGTVNVVQSKSAYNNTRGVNATTVAAQPGDLITYTLTVTNTGSAQAAGYIVSDDLSNVLQFATVTSTNGGSLNGSAISWPAATVAAGATVTDTFQVTVKSSTNFYGSAQMVNTFGNTVTIQLANIQPVYVQPQQPVYYNNPQPVYVQQQPQPVYIQPQQPTVVVQQPLLQVQQPQVLGATYVAPKTGVDSDLAFAFAGFVTTASAAIRKRSWIAKLFKK